MHLHSFISSPRGKKGDALSLAAPAAVGVAPVNPVAPKRTMSDCCEPINLGSAAAAMAADDCQVPVSPELWHKGSGTRADSGGVFRKFMGPPPKPGRQRSPRLRPAEGGIEPPPQAMGHWSSAGRQESSTREEEEEAGQEKQQRKERREKQQKKERTTASRYNGAGCMQQILADPCSTAAACNRYWLTRERGSTAAAIRINGAGCMQQRPRRRRRSREEKMPEATRENRLREEEGPTPPPEIT